MSLWGTVQISKHEVEIAKQIENNIERLKEFVKVHEAELRFIDSNNE